MEQQEVKKKNKMKIFLTVVFGIIGSALLVGIGLLWQWKTTFMAVVNAFYLSGILFFAFGWMVLMINMNIFSPLIYLISSTFKKLIGKMPKYDYYGYLQNRKENAIDRKYYLIPFIICTPNIVVAIALNIINYYI